MRRILIVVAVTAVVLLGGAWIVEYADQSGYERGYAAAVNDSQSDDIATLTTLLETAATQAKHANATSLRLSHLVQKQAADDAKTTEELRHALSKTSAERVDCRFSADIMQQLKQARDRAASAATSGITGAMPHAD
ncbi:hypothetical protein [Neptuniibacter marinus]|uniref:hypothetical protein n=1 Tax=Neptuniibacter marinus TaxID=1806670 RepID=UPI003B5B9A31